MKESTLMGLAVVVAALAGWLVISLVSGSQKMVPSDTAVHAPVGGKSVQAKTLLNISTNRVNTELKIK